MAQFTPDKFIDFIEFFDPKNSNHREAFLSFARESIAKDPGLFNDDAEWVRIYRSSNHGQKPKDTAPVVKEYNTLLKVSNFSQPDSSTCQSACIAMAINNPDIKGIRNKLLATGMEAGSPAAMGKVIGAYTKKYKFDSNASLVKVYEWLKAGEFLITHGWFTGSGHVICLDGLKLDEKGLGHQISVKDPWSEFNASAWRYDKPSKFYDGYYSSRCIYASCVAGTSVSNAQSIYNSGHLDTSRGGMWVHRFMV